jgi:hypothetical protein
MLVSIVLFCFGSKKYKRLPPSGSVVPTIIKVVSVGVRARLAQGLRDRAGNGHWLDAAKVLLTSRQILLLHRNRWQQQMMRHH